MRKRRRTGYKKPNYKRSDWMSGSIPASGIVDRWKFSILVAGVRETKVVELPTGTGRNERFIWAMLNAGADVVTLVALMAEAGVRVGAKTVHNWGRGYTVPAADKQDLIHDILGGIRPRSIFDERLLPRIKRTYRLKQQNDHPGKPAGAHQPKGDTPAPDTSPASVMDEIEKIVASAPPVPPITIDRLYLTKGGDSNETTATKLYNTLDSIIDTIDGLGCNGPDSLHDMRRAAARGRGDALSHFDRRTTRDKLARGVGRQRPLAFTGDSAGRPWGVNDNGQGSQPAKAE